MNKPLAVCSGRAFSGHPDLVVEVRRIAQAARERAGALDSDTSFPAEDIGSMIEAGVLTAPLPVDQGGGALAVDEDHNAALAQVLMLLGAASLSLGRIFEGHVNAVKLVSAYGTASQIEWISSLVHRGELLGVWNTEATDGVRLVEGGGDRHLQGKKIFCSGAGQIRYPLITARTDDGRLLMVMPEIDNQERADLSEWAPQGMRASASGRVDFSGLWILDHQILGAHDDFHKQPLFSTGAWRFAAVQVGGISAVLDAARFHLVDTGRGTAPHQRARIGTAMLAFQSAKQWVVESARISDDPSIDPTTRVAHVNLARLAVERAALEVLELAHRSVGLPGFQRSHPLERLSRDLATYLRQPNPDGALDAAADFVLRAPGATQDIFPWP